MSRRSGYRFADKGHAPSVLCRAPPRGFIMPRREDVRMNLARSLLSLVGLLAAITISPALAADAWAPSRAMRLIVPFPPGGTADLLGRLLAQHFSDTLGQPTVVE